MYLVHCSGDGKIAFCCFHVLLVDIAYQMTGVVKSIGMFSTYVETTKGEAIYIPNQLILSKGLFNFKRTKKVGIWFHMQISIDTPPEKIEDLRHRCKRFIDENKQVRIPLTLISMMYSCFARMEEH
eukprot:TRINITY_DN428_c0_g2_i7.p1 TRINITY_DN428_c0_g2~~TRINITY_DN428_c0_g2_i7.p1  ORF type:complete len:126 (+),score=15.97 TRINITY_DN428_c0_g2_i7:25-402(+)